MLLQVAPRGGASLHLPLALYPQWTMLNGQCECQASVSIRHPGLAVAVAVDTRPWWYLSSIDSWCVTHRLGMRNPVNPAGPSPIYWSRTGTGGGTVRAALLQLHTPAVRGRPRPDARRRKKEKKVLLLRFFCSVQDFPGYALCLPGRNQTTTPKKSKVVCIPEIVVRPLL